MYYNFKIIQIYKNFDGLQSEILIQNLQLKNYYITTRNEIPKTNQRTV